MLPDSSRLATTVTPESCYYQRCLGCYPQETEWPGSPVECHPSNWVSAQWVHNIGHPPPTTDSRIPIEYRCLKMVATPDNKSLGNTVDVIRGCVPRAQVDSVCLGLLAVERARGHSNARCTTCNRNNLTPESCYYQRCLGCYPQETEWPGSPVECHPSNWVSAQWVHNIGHPPPTTDSRIPIEYRCLKMVATPDNKSLGNTVDVIRGCVPRAQVDSVCLGLLAVERARGHSNARCTTCNRNNCNAAVRTDVVITTPIAILILYYVLR
ncbi:unnamed protein product [Parnassius apollo]|uniref:(apollo) hypothetical protein n=1 Tax=Parnassius apollo TaxID=110799 RepID=A0A8S3W5K8_PARAO|nr:unnamed protein product [Parnassius apollo]